VNRIDPLGLMCIDPLHYSLLAPPDPVTGAGGGIAWMPEFTPTSFYMPPGTTIPRYLGADSGSHIAPVIVGAVVIDGSSGITIGSVISGVAAILAGIGIGEGIHEAIERNKANIKQVRDAAKNPRSLVAGSQRQTTSKLFTRVSRAPKDPHGKVSYQELLDAWREVLCR
jgi:hypothetical protein